ncbi:MAG: putative bifunctional diguanylate cyclase/phosphodiesterase [Pseudochelatococcus sp.]|jgi:EAL domain-containing protein (putative c-di-GMP-specific phosphodiesterase class I)/GGDEF domain-containing protein|uniref:putative bifunctional diguanylate cyclase/phosphodiesterase n=1 Tax=Pseudochelatococcus sp. TaxID=2020869 RepID=UPI003D8F73F3
MATIVVLDRREDGTSAVTIPTFSKAIDIVMKRVASGESLTPWVRSALGGAEGQEGAGGKPAGAKPAVVIIKIGAFDDATGSILHDLRQVLPGTDVPVMVVSEKPGDPFLFKPSREDAVEVFSLEAGNDAWIGRLRQLLEGESRQRGEGSAQVTRVHPDDEAPALPRDPGTFDEELRREITRSAGGTLALHIIRVDSYNVVANAFGLEAGRRLLDICLNRLFNSVGNRGVVGRHGVDCLAVLQRGGKGPQDAELLAQRMAAQLSGPCVIFGHRISLAVTIGVAVCPDGGEDYDVLAHGATLAIDNAARSGRRVAFYHPGLLDDARQKAALDIDLRNALTRRQFFLQFQPQISLSEGRVIGAEALIRWRRPNGRVEQPGVFLPYAEQSGLICEIDEWVLLQACRTARQWHDAGMPLRIGVNLSSVQFARRSIPGLVARVLSETSLDPRYLDIELTESAVMHEVERVTVDLACIRAFGVSVSIDDFGVGYSSLHFLQQLRADRLKIDRDFVRNLTVNRNDRAILRAIVTLGHELGFEIVVEGIETADQLAILREESCDEVQGFLFARPMSILDFMTYTQRASESGDLVEQMVAAH